MKRISFILLLCLLQNTAKATDSLLQMALSSIENCYEDEANTMKVEITDEGLMGLLSGSRVVPRNTKCLRYCIMRKNKLLNEENFLDAEEMLQLFVKVFQNTIDENLLKEVIQKCSEDAKKEMDRCEQAYFANMCIIANLKDKGIDNA